MAVIGLKEVEYVCNPGIKELITRLIFTAEMNNGEPLFHKMITMSGSAIEMWSLDPDPESSFVNQIFYLTKYQRLTNLNKYQL